MDCYIQQADTLSEQDQNLVWQGIELHTQGIVGATGRHELIYLLKSDAGEIQGAVQGNYDNFGWLWIDSLWVSEAVRGLGYGTMLLNTIEQAALDKQCHHSHLTSFSYQAADFYLKQHYTVFAELDNYVPEQIIKDRKADGADPIKGNSRYWLKKSLK